MVEGLKMCCISGIAEVPEAEISNDLGGAMPVVGKLLFINSS